MLPIMVASSRESRYLPLNGLKLSHKLSLIHAYDFE
jgi:hypothetical protein